MKYSFMLAMVVAVPALGGNAPTSQSVSQESMFRPGLFDLKLQPSGTEVPSQPKPVSTWVAYRVVSGPSVEPDVRSKVLSRPAGDLIDDRR